MGIIKRMLSEENMERMKHDFKFLHKAINPSSGELDIFLRENCFNIYYKGNSLARVTFLNNNEYGVSINSKFFENSPAASDARFNFLVIGREPFSRYYQAIIPKDMLHPLFQSKNLRYFKSRIKKVAYQEELVIEQQIITDNRVNDDIIIIDRQVLDTVHKGRVDLLALCKTPEGNYNFLILEVKLGNSKDIDNRVVDQMHSYMDHIERYFDDYSSCYEENYRQSYELGYLRTASAPAAVTIVPPVKGKVLVAGYSGLGRASILRVSKSGVALRFSFQQFNMTVKP